MSQAAKLPSVASEGAQHRWCRQYDRVGEGKRDLEFVPTLELDLCFNEMWKQRIAAPVLKAEAPVPACDITYARSNNVNPASLPRRMSRASFASARIFRVNSIPATRSRIA